MYLKSIVYRQDKCVELLTSHVFDVPTDNSLSPLSVFLAQNIYCQNYVSGCDTVFMSWHNLVNDNAPKVCLRVYVLPALC
jgi:hypothetical protein